MISSLLPPRITPETLLPKNVSLSQPPKQNLPKSRITISAAERTERTDSEGRFMDFDFIFVLYWNVEKSLWEVKHCGDCESCEIYLNKKSEWITFNRHKNERMMDEHQRFSHYYRVCNFGKCFGGISTNTLLKITQGLNDPTIDSETGVKFYQDRSHDEILRGINDFFLANFPEQLKI